MQPPNLTAPELLAKWQHVLDKTFDIFSWTSPTELCFLADCASRAGTVFEVGCYHGRSSKVMTTANSAMHLFAVDLPQDERCWKILNANLGLNVLGERGNLDAGFIVVRRGTSSSVSWDLNHRADFAFIDGGHLFEDVSGDIANLLPHMAPGAILSGHDYRHNDMNDGVNRGVLAHFRLEELRFFESIWWVKLP